MSTKYPQGVITATPPFQSTTAQSYSGVWTLEQLGKNYFYYQQPVAKSLRFRSSATAYLNRTPSTGGNRTTWTWSGWVKRGSLGGNQALFSVAGTTDATYFLASISSDTIYIGNYSTVILATTQVLRDPSAWYHLVIVLDTTQAAANDRLKLYLNGTQITAFSNNNIATYYTQNSNQGINQAASHSIGRETQAGVYYFDGYMAEVNFIDGQALDASYFGQLSTITGVWAPKKYVGSYGGNGFYLPFTDATSTTTIGYDYSGNGNNWTTNNISLTSGVTYDSMWDSPTSYDNGVTGVGNYAVLNPLAYGSTGSSTVNNGNLSFSNSVAHASITSTIGVTSGKFYFESTVVSSGPVGLGFTTSTTPYSAYPGITTGLWWVYDNTVTFNIYSQTTTSFSGSSKVAANQVWQIALDMANGNAWFGINNVWYDSTGGTTGNPTTGANPTWSSIPTTSLIEETKIS